MIEFKTPKMPPLGALNLNLFDVTCKIYSEKYTVCTNCKAKYSYGDYTPIEHFTALTDIPSYNNLINKFLENELPNHPSNTIYKVIWKKTHYKKQLSRKSYFLTFIPFYKSINSLCSKLYSPIKSLIVILQHLGLIRPHDQGFGSESETVQIGSNGKSTNGNSTPIPNLPHKGFIK